MGDRKSTRLNSSHTEIYTLSLHDALPIFGGAIVLLHLAGFEQATVVDRILGPRHGFQTDPRNGRSEEHTSELQSHRDLHSFPTRRSSDLRRSHCPVAPCRLRAGDCSRSYTWPTARLPDGPAEW